MTTVKEDQDQIAIVALAEELYNKSQESKTVKVDISETTDTIYQTFVEKAEAILWLQKDIAVYAKIVDRIDRQDWSQGYLLPDNQKRIRKELRMREYLLAQMLAS